jgi:hypothetical protein
MSSIPSARTVPFISGSTRSLNAEMNPKVSFGIALLGPPKFGVSPRHSGRASDDWPDPESSKVPGKTWIPAFAGMTARTFRRFH